MSPSLARAPVAVVALAGVAVLAGGLHYASSSAAERADRPPEQRTPRVTATAGVPAGELHPGGAVTGNLLLSATGREPVEVTSASFETARTTTPGCRTTAAYASTVEVSDTAPLVVPAGDGAGGPVVPMGWTAFLPLDADDACQGAVFRSALVLDGRRVATVTATAAQLPRPGTPVAGLTTPTRAAVSWPAVTPAPAGQSEPAALPPAGMAYAVERTPFGTSAWSPACGSSAAAPLRALACTDTGLAPGTAYAYRVTSVLGAWRAVGRPSAEVRTRPAPRG